MNKLYISDNWNKEFTKKIKEKSIYINELANYEQLTVSSKTNDNIFELQKKIIGIL